MQRNSESKQRSDDHAPLPVDLPDDPQPIAADEFRRLRLLEIASHANEPETIEELRAVLDSLRSEEAGVRSGKGAIGRRKQAETGKGKKERSR